MTEKKNKPCPFCGATLPEDPSFGYGTVICNNCDAMMDSNGTWIEDSSRFMEAVRKHIIVEMEGK